MERFKGMLQSVLRAGKTGEKGQGMTELAIALPVLMLILCSVIETGWLGYHIAVNSYTYQNMVWGLDGKGIQNIDMPDELADKYYRFSDREAGELMEAYLDELMEQDTYHVRVENLVMEMIPRTETEKSFSTDTEERRIIKRYLSVKGTYVFEIPVLTPMGKIFSGKSGTIKIQRSFDREKLYRIVVVRG